MDKIYSANVNTMELTPWDDEGEADAVEDAISDGRICILVGGPEDAELKVAPLEQADGNQVMVGVYACGPGRTNLMLEQNETIHILEGEVRVELDNGDAVELGPGDIAFLPKGHLSTWTIKTPFKELFVLHD